MQDTQVTEEVAPTTSAIEEIHPYVHRATVPRLERPFLQITLMYIVREGHEEEDTVTVEAAAARAGLRGGAFVVKNGALKQVRIEEDEAQG